MELSLAWARVDVDAPPVVELSRAGAMLATERERAASALASVQALPFVRDPPGVELLARGEYTARHGGDCLRLAPLVVVVASRLGVVGDVLWLRVDDAAEDHVAARLFVDGSWWWAEATIRGARLGENPWEAKARTGARGGL